VLNGAIRELLITPRFGEQGWQIVSTAILCAAIVLVAWFMISSIGPKNGFDPMGVGIGGWLQPSVLSFLPATMFSATAGKD